MSPYCAAAAASSTVCCGGRPSITETSPNWRSPSTSTTGSADRFAIATATLIAMQVLPTPPLVENTTIRRPGSPLRVAGVCDAARHGAGEQLADPVDRLVEARLAADHHRVARAGAQRLLEHIGRQLVHREHRAELGVRAREPVHVLEAHRAHEARDRTPRRRVARRQVLDELFDRLELRGVGELDGEPRPERVVRLDDRDVEAGSLDACRRDRGERLHCVYRVPLAGAAVPPLLEPSFGGSSTR